MEIPLALSLDDVILVPQRSEIESRSHVSLRTQIAKSFFLEIPIIATNMDQVTGVEMAIAISVRGGLALMPRFDSPESEADKIAEVKKAGARVFAAVGLRDDSLKRAKLSVRAGADGILLDVAHGHMTKVLTTIKLLKRAFKLPLIAGTIATYEGAYDIFKAGADTVKVGVGAGSICITRVQTGVGVPQLTAIMEAAKAARKFKNKFVMADAGMKNSGDIVKALAAGASAISTGSLLAGTDEAPGETHKNNGYLYKEYNGSTSALEKKRQMERGNGHGPHFSLHVEGVEAMVRYKGSLSQVLDELCAGIRSGFSYCGARNIKELWQRAQFVRITQAGMRESQAHDVEMVVTTENPENFSNQQPEHSSS